MHISHYDYVLPPELIAQQPPQQRSDARMLVVHRRTGVFEHRCIDNLPEYLTENDKLVVNNSKVIPARLIGIRTQTGGKWEGLVVSVKDTGYEILSHTKGKMQIGETILAAAPNKNDTAEFKIVDRTYDGMLLIEAVNAGQTPPLTILNNVGHTPIPPYIRKGRMQPSDAERYQTVYAEHSGSVAAPTAGLHFTPELLDEIRKKGVGIAAVTLHVGIGTFKPVTAENLDDHHIHSEYAVLPPETADALNQCSGRVVAVGTTSVRVLESAASRPVTAFSGETSLFIKPPYQFRNVDMLLTNFHFPKSTLLVLVRTFGGDALIQEAYNIAVKEKYRFFSYGDAMLITD